MNEGAEDAAFRLEVRGWLEARLEGDFADARGLGGPGSEHEGFERRLEWNRELAAAGWSCIGWPESAGGRGASLNQQVIFHEEYARAQAPSRVNYIGEELLGPTVIAFGTDEQKKRFLPAIRECRELWCQGYSEPDAGSDLAAVRTSARLEGGEWVINGQKTWTSLAEQADWCFVLARTDPSERRNRGLSFLLVPMDAPGITKHPIVQSTGTSEFCEVFFDDVRTDAANVIGEPGDGWRIAIGTLGFERGVATLGLQIAFRDELDRLIAEAKANGAYERPVLRDQLTRASIEIEIMRFGAIRSLDGVASGVPGPESSITKLFWARWHRRLGELAMEVRGTRSLIALQAPYELDEWQRLFLFSRADTIYAGSDEIQREIIADRVLSLPKVRRT